MSVPEPDGRIVSSQNTAGALYDEFQSRVRAGATTAGMLSRSLSAPGSGATLSPMAQLALLKSWLDSFRPLPPTVMDELRQYSTVSLTYHSNAIEGNTLSRHETEMVLAHGVTVGGKSLVEHLEVIGHRDAMEYMLTLADESTPIGEWELKSLHGLILAPVDQGSGRHEAGRYRTLDVRAAGTGYVYPPHYQVAELMNDFVLWLQSHEATALAPIDRASQAHYRLVTIHPFRDGNGRAARLLMNLVLLRAGYPITVLTTERRLPYIEALVYAQSHADNIVALQSLVIQACRESFDEHFRILATAAESRGRGEAFYDAMLAAPPTSGAPA